MANNTKPTDAGAADDQGWRKKLQKGDLLDALDTDRKWCVAEVLNARTEKGVQEVFITYHGWEHKWDEWIARNSERLAPPRTKTQGDTTKEGWLREREALQSQRRAVVPTAVPVPPANVQTSPPLDKLDLEFRRALHIGQLCDVFFPQDGRWHLAEVIAENSEKIKARFHDMDHEEIVSRPSQRLSPPMTKSGGGGGGGSGGGGGGGGGGSVDNHASASNTHTHVHHSVPEPTAVRAAYGGPVVPLDGNALKVGDLIDCLDTEQKWRLAEVTKVRPRDVHVHYIGWGTKWDEWIDRNHARIKPPRTHSEGDTGPKRKQTQHAQPVMGYPGNMYQGGYPGFQPFPPLPMPPPRPNYDCIGNCKWRRVMSSGLVGKELAALDSVFDKCCLLQDEFQDSLLSSSISSDLPQKLVSLEEELTKLKVEFPASTFHLEMCMRVVDGLKSTLKDSDNTAKRQALAGSEDVYMSALGKNFHFVEIPADGNCLFAAARRGWGLIEKLRKSDSESDEDIQRQIDVLVREEQQVSKEQSLALSRDFRHRAIELIRTKPKFLAVIKSEVKEVVLKHGQPGENATAKAIYAEIKKKFENPLEAAESDINALEAYLTVMGTDGIYGTIVEVEAISDSVQVPVHVFYRASSNEKAEGPSRIIGGEHGGVPINLAFYMGQQHYKLLVPRSISKGALAPENESKQENKHNQMEGETLTEGRVGEPDGREGKTAPPNSDKMDNKWSNKPAKEGQLPPQPMPKSPHASHAPAPAGPSVASGNQHSQQSHSQQSTQPRVLRIRVTGLPKDLVVEFGSHQQFAALIDHLNAAHLVRERDNLPIARNTTPEDLDWKPTDAIRVLSQP